MGYGIDPDFFKTDPVYLEWEEEARGGQLIVVGKDGYEAFVFPPKLYYIITNRIPVKSSKSGKVGIVRGKPLIEVYVRGYKKGRSYFQDHYGRAMGGAIYSPAWRETIEHFYQHGPNKKFRGWEYYLTSSPVLFNDQRIADYGYYAGMIHELEQIRLIHPGLFADSDKPKNPTPEFPKVLDRSPKMKEIALYCIYEGIEMTSTNAGQWASQYGFIANNSGKALYDDYCSLQLKSNRVDSLELRSKRVISYRIRLLELVITMLQTDRARAKATADLKAIKSIYDDSI